MNSALAVHRLHFAFTATFHYIFPQLTMGLALLIVVLKLVALVRQDDSYEDAARFGTRIFAINFAMGVVTGIPMEFQFGTNWANFSKTAGGGGRHGESGAHQKLAATTADHLPGRSGLDAAQSLRRGALPAFCRADRAASF